eukprot:5679352-Prymnesium_polylepis.1
MADDAAGGSDAAAVAAAAAAAVAADGARDNSCSGGGGLATRTGVISNTLSSDGGGPGVPLALRATGAHAASGAEASTAA